MKNSAFRGWCQDVWHDHLTEVKDWEGKIVNYDTQYWFNKNKWFLKQLYQNRK